MVSQRGQAAASAPLPTASSVGEITVQEFGYGLGPPTGILVLRYPPALTVPDFPENRDDLLHQLFWSPDGMMSVRRGGSARFVSSQEILWIRAGVVAEVRGLGSQTVLRVCVRRAPTALTALPSGVVELEAWVGDLLLSLARPGVAEETGLHARVQLLDALARTRATPVDHTWTTESPAHVVARTLLRNPADATGLVAWADRLHVSPKTLQRDLERAFDVPFTSLRTQIRLRAAVAHLADHSVTETAHLVGYSSASSFVAAFTREYGETPGSHAGRLSPASRTA